ncbi:hypothetical protein, partial [Litorivivens sp.]|uniref:hypothetical protein n=1 Tax=Litorivivens sp. TaxID=2020868 RepID=UPI003566EA32
KEKVSKEKGHPVPQSLSAVRQAIPCALRSRRRERKLGLSPSDTRSLVSANCCSARRLQGDSPCPTTEQ